MIRPLISTAFGAAALCLLIGGCAGASLPKAPAAADLADEAFRGDKPDGPEGACWARDETPAVIETVTEQIAEAAGPENPAGYSTETRQEIIRPREQIWFRTPCDGDLTPDLVASLQRALTARGLLQTAPTGLLDAPTRIAIRAFQRPRGLNSDRLSLAAARDLGIVPKEFAARPGLPPAS